jgi:hypothetical protein
LQASPLHFLASACATDSRKPTQETVGEGRPKKGWFFHTYQNRGA